MNHSPEHEQLDPPAEGAEPTVFVNGEPRRIVPCANVAQLLAELGVNLRHVAVEVNRELVPRAAHAERILRPGDRLEVVTLVGGG